MKSWFLIALSFGLHSAQARLGDTREQVEARYGLPKSEKTPKYGKPLLEGARELTFHYQGFQIRCALLPATDGREYVVREEYKKVPRTGVIADFEIAAILKGESNGQSWSVPPKAVDLSNGLEGALQSHFRNAVADKGWVRPDGATATRQLSGLQMRLELPQALKYEAELKTIKDREARKAVPKF